ncbi:EamA family transporter [Nocardia callitridis]|uniref:EamA family transporter n=2 Tax=Nocardia callitridis TaxID=648753 RepID=A0ABP9K8R1_9NOCA
MLWGTGGLLGTLLSRATGLSPIAVATFRLAVGGLLLVAVCAAARQPWPRGRSAWRRIGAVAGLAAIFQASYFAAVAASSLGVATLITIGASPVMVAVLEHCTGRHALDRHRAVTIGLALTGLTMLVGTPSGNASVAATFGGAALALLAAAAFATVTVISANPVAGLDTMTSTGIGFTGGALLLAPLAASISTGLVFELRPSSVALLLALGLAPTAVAYTLYFRGLPQVGPGTAAVLALLEPLTGTALAAVVLGERLTPSGLAGAALLIAALLLAGRRSGVETARAEVAVNGRSHTPD